MNTPNERMQSLAMHQARLQEHHYMMANAFDQFGELSEAQRIRALERVLSSVLPAIVATIEVVGSLHDAVGELLDEGQPEAAEPEADGYVDQDLGDVVQGIEPAVTPVDERLRQEYGSDGLPTKSQEAEYFAAEKRRTDRKVATGEQADD